jgi:hypothetical protein
MAADVHGRARIGRSLIAIRDIALLPGWLQVLVTLAVAGVIMVIAHLAGVPGAFAPLIFGGALGLMTAVVTGAPQREDNDA